MEGNQNGGNWNLAQDARIG